MDFNIFEGMRCLGYPIVTISRGKIVWENDTLFVTKGSGKYITRPCFGSVFSSVSARDRERDPRKFKVEREPYNGPVISL